MKKRKILSVLTAILLAASVCGCETSSDGEEDIDDVVSESEEDIYVNEDFYIDESYDEEDIADSEDISDENEEDSDGSAEIGEEEAASAPLRGTVVIPDGDNPVKITRLERENTVPMGEDGSWTVFAYICGSGADEDIGEMLKASLNDKVRFVIQTGGAASQSGYDIPSDAISRYEISDGKLNHIEEKANANMGESETLEDFLAWGTEKYKAGKIGLVFCGKGAGSIGGVCFDENNGGDSLSLREIDGALSSVYALMTDKFEFIGFDASGMNSIEAVNITASHARYMIASDDWNYEEIGNYISKHTDCSGADLGKASADGAVSVIDLSKTDDIIIALDSAAKEMNSATSSEKGFAELTRKIAASVSYRDNNKVTGFDNTADLCALMSSACSESAAASVITAVDEAVVYSGNGAKLLVYYPVSINGTEEMSILSGIYPSPRYMAFIDRIAFGKVYGNVFGYEGDAFWLEPSSEAYTTDSFSWDETGYLDYWNLLDLDIAPRTDVFTDYSDSIYLSEFPYATDDGIEMAIDLDYINNVEEVRRAVYTADYDNGYFYELGIGAKVNFSFETGIAGDGYVKSVCALPDGQPLSMYIIGETETYDMYAAPVVLNGEPSVLYITKTYTENGCEFTVDGLVQGDVVAPVYYTYDDYGDYCGDSNGEDYTYDGTPLNEISLEEGEYAYSFVVRDIYGAETYTEFMVFSVSEDGEAVFDY